MTLLSNRLRISLISRLVYRTMIFNIKSTRLLFLLGNTIELVWLRTSFILLSRSLETGSPVTGGARRMKLFCVEPSSVTHVTHSYTPGRGQPPWSEHCQSSLTVGNSLGNAINLTKQVNMYLLEEIYQYMEPFRLHPTLILLFFKECKFYCEF